MEEKNENLENNDEFKKRIQNFLKNFFGEDDGMLFDTSNMSISDPSILDELFNKNDGLTYRTSTYITPDGSKITVSSGYGAYDSKKVNTNMSVEQKIKKLERDLEVCVEKEEYEKAAEIRDLIKSFKKEGKEPQNQTTENNKDNMWDL